VFDVRSGSQQYLNEKPAGRNIDYLGSIIEDSELAKAICQGEVNPETLE